MGDQKNGHCVLEMLADAWRLHCQPVLWVLDPKVP